jgi:hypothetical protein
VWQLKRSRKKLNLIRWRAGGAISLSHREDDGKNY